MIAVTLGVLTTTAQYIQDRPVREFLGLVSGESLVLVGRAAGGDGTRANQLQRARQRALQILASRASAHGATVVIGIHIDYVAVSVGKLLVAATGTAVRL